jgi:glycosyltransferase involved in cell wall biosynthesis
MEREVVDAPAVSPPVASIVVPHLNTPDLLGRCLSSVMAQALDNGAFEVIVVDNGSTVSLDGVRASFPSVRFLLEPQPGPGLARNRGAAAAAAPVLAFIDADCRAAPGWLQAAVDAVTVDPARTVVGGDIRVDAVDPARMTGMEAFESVFGFRQRMYIETKHFSVTANLAMGRAVLDAVGPFGGIDIAEDLDWGRRAWALGYRTRFEPAMQVWHPARPDFASMARKWQRLIAHERRAHVASGAAAWRWRLRAAALVASVPVEALKLLTSPLVTGVGNRARGIAALARIRAYRAAEMLRAAGPGAPADAMAWNRTP